MSNTNIFAAADLTMGQMNAIVKKLGGHEGALKFLRDELVVQVKAVAQATYQILVDYTKSLKEMIVAGHYDRIDDDITENRSPVTGVGTQELTVELVHFGRNMSSASVEAELNKRGLRPATLTELLAFGEKYPDLQRQIPIIALGSVARVRDRRRVPCLNVGDGRRRLGLVWYDGDWLDRYRFLAVRN